MDQELTERPAEKVEPFSIKVSGGLFHVSEVLLEAGQSSDHVVATIKITDEDRWFVMVSENPDEALDSLAMIDDQLEFQVLARGLLKQE